MLLKEKLAARVLSGSAAAAMCDLLECHAPDLLDVHAACLSSFQLSKVSVLSEHLHLERKKLGACG